MIQYISIPFFFIDKQYSIEWIYYICLLIYQLMEILGCFYFLALWIMLLQTFMCKCFESYVFISSEYIPRSGIAEALEVLYLTF
jgi:hypothetical protein